MARRSLADRRILLTGASSGIGRALALQLAPFGVRLLLLARREAPLLELAAELKRLGASSAEPIVGDVTDAELRANVADQIRRDWGGLDMLINNAGVSAHGRFEGSSPAVLRQIMEVNFFAAAELARETFSLLKAGDDSLVVNIGSILGHRGVPFNSEYCASKFALRGWSEAIRPELARDGIDLLLVSPGTTDTEFFDHLLAQGEKLPWGEQQGVPVEKVAAQIVRAIERRRHEISPNWRGRLLGVLNRLSPRLVDRLMNRYG
ncbi:MAG: SDR family NAD(P)-dependent oxidoreductase [Planctomycetes bacterium]|nr:SDR family NAD(P)-dependent oxidoreductase [Planctomycetota bacterium]